MRTSAILTLVFVAVGCGWEHYYGPFELVVPTAIMEAVDVRTFKLPLDNDSLRELEELEECRQQNPERSPPCICDFPGLRVGELQVRLDYSLELLEGAEATAMIFMGLAVGSGMQLPREIPGRPEIKVLLEHHHMVRQGKQTQFSFSRQEIEQAELGWAMVSFPDCPQTGEDLPGFLEPFFGLVLETKQKTRMKATLVVWVAGGE